MGTIGHFDLAKIIKRYGTRYFIETGTGTGGGLEYAAQFPFYRLYSIEIEERLLAAARERVGPDERVVLLNAKSEPALDLVLQMIPQDVPTLFWLDAHFPGADFGLARYGQENDVDVRLPLERELEVISRRRPLGKDVILIDDLRIYEDGAFTAGTLPAEHQTLPPEKRNIEFVFRIFAKSHQISRDYEHQGYVILVPH